MRQGTPATVLIDADNTLWNTDAVYAAAQLNLLSEVERRLNARSVAVDRLAFVRSVDQAIARRHHSGLRYPSKLLALGLADVLGGSESEAAVRRALTGEGVLAPRELEELTLSFASDLDALPALRIGVMEGLSSLKASDAGLIVVTEGNRERIIATAADLKIDHLIDQVIEGRKEPPLFHRLRRLSSVAVTAFMVGDQLDRDIIPAKAAGLTTIYFPSEFRPPWAPQPSAAAPDFVVRSFADVPGIVRAQLAALAEKDGD